MNNRGNQKIHPNKRNVMDTPTFLRDEQKKTQEPRSPEEMDANISGNGVNQIQLDSMISKEDLGGTALVRGQTKKSNWVDYQQQSDRELILSTRSLASNENVHLIKNDKKNGDRTYSKREVELYQQQIRQVEVGKFQMTDGALLESFTNDNQEIQKTKKNREITGYSCKKSFLRKYGFQFELPTYYILEAKTFERDVNYIFRISRYVLPTRQNFNVYTHMKDGSNQKSKFSDIFSDKIGNLCLDLLFRGDAYPEIQDQLVIPDAEWAKKVFSDDHTLFALLIPTKRRIQDPSNFDQQRTVHKISIIELTLKQDNTPDPNSLITKLRQEQVKLNFMDTHIKYDLSFTKYLKFDNNKKFLIAVGEKKVFVLDLQKQRGSFYQVPEQIIEKILDVKFTSFFDKESGKFKSIKCMIACKRIGFKQIFVYDLFEKIADQENYVQKQQQLYLQQKMGLQKVVLNENQKVFTYQYPESENQIVKFSRDGKSLMYADKKEKLLIQSLFKGSIIKRKLLHLEDKNVYMVTPDPDPQGEGFYALCSQDYDKYIYIVHSNRCADEQHNGRLKIIRTVEPGLLKTFELFVKVMYKQKLQIESKKAELSQGTSYETKNLIQLIQFRDYIFTIDQLTFLERKEMYPQKKEKIGAQASLIPISLRQASCVERNKVTSCDGSNGEFFHQSNIEYKKAEKCEVSAFSVNWPFVAFSGLNDYLIIMNAFEHEIFHRVQVFDAKEDIDITQTYITDTNDLFCLVYQNQKYYLFMIDLDSANIRERSSEDIDLNSCYQIGEAILIYDEKLVDCNPIQNMHIRGSSRKEPLDSGKKCVCLFLHGFKVYLWIQIDPRVQGTQITLALQQPITSMNWYTDSDSALYLMQDDPNQDSNNSKIEGISENNQSNIQVIKKIEINYSAVDISQVFQETSMTHTILAFSYDRIAKKFIMVLKSEGRQARILGKIVYIFKIYDLNSNKIQLSIEISNTELIGRLLSGLYTLLDGHLYFNNNVIKIRYDLLKNSNYRHTFSERDYFDFYYNILEMQEGMDMLSNTPLDSMKSHRLAYIKQDKISLQRPYSIIFLPYLHERRVYLNHVAEDEDCFYTSLETHQDDIKAHTLELAKLCNFEEKKFEKNLDNKLYGQSTLIKSYVDKPLENDNELDEDIDIKKQGSNNNQRSGFKDSIKLRLLQEYYKSEEIMSESTMSIIAMNLNQQTYKVFGANGILMNQVNYEKQARKYGNPIAVSPDGLNYIFKKSDDQIQIMKARNDMDESSIIRQQLKLTVMSMTIFGMCHIKTINIMDGLRKYFKNDDEDELEDLSFKRFMKRQPWLFQASVEDLQRNCYIVARINNNCDVFIQLKRKPQMRMTTQASCEDEFNPGIGDSIKSDQIAIQYMLGMKFTKHFQGSRRYIDPKSGQHRICDSEMVYYYESLPHGIKLHDLAQKNGLKLSNTLEQKIRKRVANSKNNKDHINNYVLEMEGMFENGFELNDRYLFFKDFDRIRYIDLVNPIYQLNRIQLQEINLNIDVKLTSLNKLNIVKDIHTGYDQNQIAIVIRQTTSEVETLLIWDMTKNNEKMLIEVKQPYKVLWDHYGEVFVLQQNKLIDVNKNCSIKVYSFQNLKQLDDQSFKYSQLYNKGIRVDGRQRNWLILKEYLALPFCYMTFVIQDHIQRHGFQTQCAKNRFDPTPYNFIWNKTSIFLENSLVTEDHDHLKYILQNFAQIDDELLEILSFTAPYVKIDEENGERDLLQKSALSRAIEQRNYKNVQLILQYMSKANRQNMCLFNNLFHELLDYQSFQSFLANLLFNTQLMEQKQIFKVNSEFSSKVVAICESPTAFIDESVYVSRMGELLESNKSGHTHSVKVQALCVSWIFEKHNEKFALKFFDSLLDQQNLDLFKLKGLQILIDYLYWRMQSYSTKIMFPLYMVFHSAFFYLIFINEQYQENLVYDVENKIVLHSQESKENAPWFGTFNTIWFIICSVNLSYVGLRIICEGLATFFTDPAEVGDLLVILLGFVVAILNYQIIAHDLPEEGNNHDHMDHQHESNFEKYKHVCMTVRIIFTFMAQLFVFKLFVFMKGLNHNFDILFEVIVTIFYDILYMVIILIIWCLVSALSFFLLGQNQLAFDQVSEEDQENITYGTPTGSLNFIFQMILGETDYEGFNVGNGSQTPLLSFMFIISTFIIMIHLLNMLIAVMGNTFNERAGIAEELNYKNHLQFVRNKWYLIDHQFKELRNSRYLIAATHESIGQEDQNENEQQDGKEDKNGRNILQNRLVNDIDWWVETE